MLAIDAEEIVVQIVTVPHGCEFWRKVGKESGTAEGAVSEMIDAAIRAKSKIDAKGSMNLAIDIAHAGKLADQRFVRAYLDTYGDPVNVHGFAAVWLVGPTQALCTHLGTSRW